MSVKTKHMVIFFSIALIVVSLPIMVYKFALNPNVSTYLVNTLGVNLKSFIGIILDYFSILLNLALGVVVFWQVERINALQMTQNETFLRVENLDYSFSYEDARLTIDKSNEGYNVAHVFTQDKKAILTHVNIGKGQGKPLFLPIRFITSNQQMIVSLALTNVKIFAKERNRILSNKTYPIGGDTIETVLANDSKFIIGLGMIVPKESHIDELHLAFVLILENQDRTTQKLRINITLLRTQEDTDFVISSSRLERLK